MAGPIAPAPTPSPSTPPSSAAPSSGERRPPRTARMVGYGVAAGVNGVLLYLVNVAPGWQWVTFLTDDFTEVLGILNASLVVAIVVNLLWVLADPRWFRSLGQVVQSGIGLAVILAMLDVFPFDFSGWAFDATWLTRFVLVVAAIATGIGLLVQVVTLLRLVVTAGTE